MNTTELPPVALHAYFRLMELNLAAWQPQVAKWLHSSAAEEPLRELLEHVPCSTTIH
jgi:hypothetical protein